MYIANDFKGFDNILMEGMFLRLITNFINKNNVLTTKTGKPIERLDFYNYHGLSKEFFDLLQQKKYLRKKNKRWYLNPFLVNRTFFFTQELFEVYNDYMKLCLDEKEYESYKQKYLDNNKQ